MQKAHDYFDTPELIPENVRAVLESFDENADPYKELARINAELLEAEWTFDYYLDAEPYNLMPKAIFDKLVYNNEDSTHYIN